MLPFIPAVGGNGLDVALKHNVTFDFTIDLKLLNVLSFTCHTHTVDRSLCISVWWCVGGCRCVSVWMRRSFLFNTPLQLSLRGANTITITQNWRAAHNKTDNSRHIKSKKESGREIEIEGGWGGQQCQASVLSQNMQVKYLVPLIIGCATPLVSVCIKTWDSESQQLRLSYSGPLSTGMRVWCTEQRKSLYEKSNSLIIKGQSFTEITPTFSSRSQELFTHTPDSYLHVQTAEMSKTTLHPQAFP